MLKSNAPTHMMCVERLDADLMLKSVDVLKTVQ